MKLPPSLLLTTMLALLTAAAPYARARSGGYDDVAAWAARDTAGIAQLRADLERADSAHKVAASLNAAASRQRKTADDLIALVGRHPELRDLPELGLDPQGLRQWAQAHPDAQARRARLPAEAISVSQTMRRNEAELQRSQAAMAAAIVKHKRDPEVLAALRSLAATIQDNRRRLLRTFS